MSGKSGKRITAKKPAGSTRTSALADGASGRVGKTKAASERNVDNATRKRVSGGGA